MLANIEDLGKLMTAEQGKPLAKQKAKLPTPLPLLNGSPRKLNASTVTRFLHPGMIEEAIAGTSPSSSVDDS
jgi:hypothetical protein